MHRMKVIKGSDEFEAVKVPVIDCLYACPTQEADEVVAWCGGEHYTHADGTYGVLINHPAGGFIARAGEWIIRSANGDFYPIRYDVLRNLYGQGE